MFMERFLCFCIALLISIIIVFVISSSSCSLISFGISISSSSCSLISFRISSSSCSLISFIKLLFSGIISAFSFVSWVVIYTFVLAVECSKVITDSLHNLFCSSCSLISFIKLLFSGIISAFSFVSWVVIYTFVLAVECSKVITDSLHNLFCLAADGLKSFAWILLDRLLNAASSTAASAVAFLLEEVPKIGGAAMGVFKEMMDKIRKGQELLVETIPMIVKAVWETMKEVLESVCSTYDEALRFVTERKSNFIERFR